MPRGRFEAPILMLLSLLASASATRAPITAYRVDDATRFTFTGRVLRGFDASAPGGVTFDLEGTTLLFTVANATFIGLNVSDRTRGGARLGVYFDSDDAPDNSSLHAMSSRTEGDPNPAGRALPPTARVATLVTSSQQSLYTLGSGGQIVGLGVGGALGVRVELLSEWSHLGDSPTGLFSFAAVVTDGVVLSAPRPPTRRLLVLGDSLSSGPGAGYTVPVTGALCGDGVLLNDWSGTWNALLCRNFSAACEVVAMSGATISGTPYNIPMSLPWALGAMGDDAWPAGARAPWSAPVDAVFVELGENDCHAFNCTAPTGRATLAASFVALAHKLSAAQPAGNALPIWFTLANHEAGQSAAMTDAVSTLRAAGFTNTALLNGTTPTLGPGGVYIANGCAGHPSAAQNELAFARLRPIVAQALGW